MERAITSARRPRVFAPSLATVVVLPARGAEDANALTFFTLLNGQERRFGKFAEKRPSIQRSHVFSCSVEHRSDDFQIAETCNR